MKIACISFTEKGRELGQVLKGLDHERYTIDHYINKEIGGIKSILEDLWKEYDGLIFISSTGIAIRLINPYIEHKTLDPAVVVIDDMGRFAISLLSGHLGGANRLAEWLAKEIGGISVITTASEGRNIESIDLFAKENRYHIEGIDKITRIAALMVNDKSIGFYSEDGIIIDYPNLVILENLERLEKGNIYGENIEGLIVVSSKEIIDIEMNIPHIYLRPKNINIGIGCKKGIEAKRIIELIENIFKEQNLSISSIRAIGTAEIKCDEPGIIETAKYFNCPLKVFTIDELGKLGDRFKKSQFVKDTLGIYSVSAPSAYLLGGELIKDRIKSEGITISISKEVKNG